jgi:hypothetical protein
MWTLLETMTENRLKLTEYETSGHICYMEKNSQQTYADLMFESGKAHNLLSRVEKHRRLQIISN